MHNPDFPTIDTTRCTGCGLCVPVCPHGIPALENNKAVFFGDHCMACGHCRGACPTGAIRVTALENGMQAFSSFSVEDTWQPSGRFSVADLVHLMQSRRSCRTYREDPVPVEMLHDLVKIGITAPSGTNSQTWTFTLLLTRRDVLGLGEQVANFFDKTNRMAQKAWLRKGMKLLGKPELDTYYKEYYDTVKQGLEDFKSRGKDILFHGAPAAIIVATRPGASCPVEDALLASQNILLGAHAMGLGTCLIGFAVQAMQRTPSIPGSLGIPPEESIHAVITVGFPRENYARFPGRKNCPIRHASGQS